ncbi:MAG: amidohydrolase family protein [Acidobacteriota bacterium]
MPLDCRPVLAAFLTRISPSVTPRFPWARSSPGVTSLALALIAVFLLAPVPAPAASAHEGHGDRALHDSLRGARTDASIDSMDEAEAAADDATEEAGDEADAAWDVAAPPLPLHETTIDVETGTWISLDISPDGRELVFDLLGDLYLLPIEGGEATALTSGLPWDMQPRFSPDGRAIAFTSDRGGGDNVWILPRREDGGFDAARQVTDESYRLVNSPAFSPDGRFLAVRKHFTSRRSLGAGEIWLYHESGADGVQLTERWNDQKDVGEPAFSPDGRHLYYSIDSTPGDFFEYNKDPNTEIYTIRRLDLDTGEDEEWISGPGGAVRPTPSPDGETLAFVRRVRYDTHLFLHDLETGAERSLVADLERDMQETWAVHGVYPTMAWTPDGGSIVYWAGGQIRRVDVKTGTVAEIPFRVRQTHQLVEPLRFRNEPAGDQVALKMLRWPQVSPDGSQVVFEALGHLWLRALPDGTPRRLTTQTDHFEAYPSWSRDGRSIVYVSWDDEELGAVRLVPASGAPAGRTLTDTPGHYARPALSPDGETVVYRRARGGYLTSPLYSRHPGLYVQPVAGGEPELLAAGGWGAHFGADSERVFFSTFEADDARALRSIGVDGDDEVTHVTSEAATEFHVSPDGRRLAYFERFRAYVAELPRSAKAFRLGPGAGGVPNQRVDETAGLWLHWSGDSSQLYWSLGPELYRRDVDEALATRADGGELAPAEAVDLGFEVPAARPSGRIALVGGRVVTMVGDRAEGASSVIEDGVVVVEGERIVAVGARDAVDLDDPEFAGAAVVDVSGKTVLPGFVDVHWHGEPAAIGIVPERNWSFDASMAFGVTTIHDPSTDTAPFFAAAQMARAGVILAPRLFSTGTILYGASGSFRAEIDSYDDAYFHLERLKKVGAFSVKSYNQPRREQRQQVVAAARELEMLVMPEGGSLFMHNMTQVVDGHTGIEHAVPVAHLYDDVLQLWAATDVGYTPTLGVGYGGLWGENYWYAKTNVWADERLLSFVPRRYVDPQSRRPVHAPDEEWNHFDIAAGCHALHESGVDVQVGAHGQREGLAVHWEMWMLGQGGMTPYEALRAGTLVGARYLGMDHALGSIEKGKLADLAIVDGDPLSDLRASKDVALVMLGGALYNAATMQPHDDAAPRRPELWFAAAQQELLAD